MIKYVLMLAWILNICSCKGQIYNATISYDENFAISIRDKNEEVVAIMIGGPTSNASFNSKDIKIEIEGEVIEPKSLKNSSALLNSQNVGKADNFILGSLNRGGWENNTSQLNFKGVSIFVKDDQITGLCVWLKRPKRDVKVTYKNELLDDLTKDKALNILTKDYEKKKYFSVQ